MTPRFTADELAALQAKLAIRDRQLEAVHRTSAALSTVTGLDDLVREALRVSLSCVGATDGSVILYGSSRDRLVFSYVMGAKADELIGTELAPTQGLAGAVFQSGQRHVSDDVSQEAEHDTHIEERLGYRTRGMVTVPLRSARGRAIGVMQVLNKAPGSFDADDVAVLEILSTQIATAIEATRLHEEARRAEAALVEYRTQLSQEMHDGVQHYLVTAVVRLELARRLIEGDPRQAAELAVNVRHTLRQASDELRYLVRRLRSPRIDQHGFLQALREHLSLYADNAPFTVDLQIEGEEMDLAPDVEHAAFRIIQEALTNAEKHAAPTAVKVSLSLTPRRLDCRVSDDGAGFDASGLQDRIDTGYGLGLAGMRQRAARVNGELEVNSIPGEGSTIRVTIPLTVAAGQKEASLGTSQDAPG